MFTCVLQRYVAATVLVLKHSASFTEGSDSMGVKKGSISVDTSEKRSCHIQ